MALREHEPIVIEDFNGLYRRGDADECPQDHFFDCNNVKSHGSLAFETRDGVDTFQDIAIPLQNVQRMYNFVTQDKNTLLVLIQGGKIYHVVDGATVIGPILTIPTMTDFAFAPFAGRAYISPFTTYNEVEKGIQNEFVYVYKGDGSAARKAGGTGPTGTITVANGAAGDTDAGDHLFGVVFETDTGYLTKPGAFFKFTTSANLSVSFSTIPVGGSTVVKRHIVATKVITNYNNDTTGYQYFFLPGATINDNVTTTLANISFFDADLLEDASHLLDNFDEIPAGACMGFYKSRLCVGAEYSNISIVRISFAGEPEAISQVDGLIILPLDGNPVTNIHELRDVLYTFKKNRTFAWADNDDVPSSWNIVPVDYGLGCPVHGIATVIDSGSSSIDYLIIATYRGLCIFNGKYNDPELSFKIADFWLAQDNTKFRQIQIVNDTVNKFFYVVLPDFTLLQGDYTQGLDPKNTKWWPFSFDFLVNAVALINTNQLIIGA